MSTGRARRRRWWLALLLANAALVPWLVLLPLGGLWLWQHGYVLWWLLAALVPGTLALLWARQVGREARARRLAEAEHESRDEAEPDADWAPRDLAAWETVQTLAGEADPAIVADRDALLDAAVQTVERVAAHYHPDSTHAVWQFTAPEALLLVERVSARLRAVLLSRVPGSHLVRLRTLVRIWELRDEAQTGWRIAHGLYDAWRVVRLLNPLAAVLAEARQSALSAALGEAGDYLRRRGARIWIEEVGRAAIELYSGRLRVDPVQLRQAAEADDAGAGVAEAQLPGPLRIVIVGQTNAGKSSLVNALLADVAAGVDVLELTAEATGYELRREGVPEAVIIDTPGLEQADPAAGAAVARAIDADCLLWVTAAHRADRAPDRAALDAVRARFAADPRRSPPPLLVIASHVDRLSPAREWAPPYDVERPARPKAGAIREALEAIAADLEVPLEDVLPLRLDPPSRRYNVDLLWARLAERFDDARRGRALRLTLSLPKRDWRRVLRQAGAGGAWVGRQLRR